MIGSTIVLFMCKKIQCFMVFLCYSCVWKSLSSFHFVSGCIVAGWSCNPANLLCGCLCAGSFSFTVCDYWVSYRLNYMLFVPMIIHCTSSSCIDEETEISVRRVSNIFISGYMPSRFAEKAEQI